MKTVAVISLVLLCTSANAEVIDSSASGFTDKVTVFILMVKPADVYRVLVHNVGDWWDPSHTFSRNSHNLSIEEKPGGCFCEKIPPDGGARHMEVVNFSPGKQLVMVGALGPLQTMAVTGAMNITLSFTDDGPGTIVDVTYAVGGYLPAGINTLAAPVDSVLQQQLNRLRNFVEHGDPNPRPPTPKQNGAQDQNRPTRSLTDKTH